MNQLSWLIYLIQVVGQLNAAGFYLILLSFVVFVITTIISLIMAGSEGPYNYIAFRKRAKYSIIGAVLGFILMTFLPTNRTMILIASSEMGERILNNPKLQGIVDPSIDLLRKWIVLENEKVGEELNNERKNRKTP